jgi:hypothetical protein
VRPTSLAEDSERLAKAKAKVQLRDQQGRQSTYSSLPMRIHFVAYHLDTPRPIAPLHTRHNADQPGKPTHRINGPFRSPYPYLEPWIQADDQTLGKNRINQPHTELFRNKQARLLAQWLLQAVA